MRTIFAEYNPHRNSIDIYTSAGYMPVSYTHLDVYKRQAVALAMDNNCHCPCENTSCVHWVSYPFSKFIIVS